jgi:hypothetical protein
MSAHAPADDEIIVALGGNRSVDLEEMAAGQRS